MIAEIVMSPTPHAIATEAHVQTVTAAIAMTPTPHAIAMEAHVQTVTATIAMTPTRHAIATMEPHATIYATTVGLLVAVAGVMILWVELVTVIHA